jgi:Rrf2 family protein
MQLTRESLYALEGLAYLSTRPHGTVVALQEIAEARELPASFLSKIFQKLARHGIMSAERGRGRGYALARGADEITVREVLSAVEGPEALDRCFFWSGRCADSNPCPLHYRFRELRPVLESWLNEITLAEFAAKWKRRRARTVRSRRRTAGA